MSESSAPNPESQPETPHATGEAMEKPRGGYIPTLDGWRALAVFGVIAYHDQLRRFGPISDSIPHSFGFLGVDLFFAISGILICTRLLEEKERKGRISLGGFYIRRIFRILPPALAYLAVVGVLGLIGTIHVGLTSWLDSLFFVNNYYIANPRNPLALYTNHFWSLGIEEQFYLLLPGILFLFPRRHTWVLAVLTAASLAYPIWIYSHHALWDGMGNGFSRFRTEMRINALLFPALVAIFLRRARFNRICMIAVSPLVVVVAQGVALHLFNMIGVPSLFLLLVPCGFPFLLVGTTLHPKSLFSRFLEWAPLRFLGRISYSLYLWQQLFFIDQHESSRATGWLGMLQSKPWSLAVLIAVATGSYYLLEKPLIRRGHRLAPPPTPGRADVGAV
jgi:peptidoglycan/LPS O-acetylase OafA/YrhL